MLVLLSACSPYRPVLHRENTLALAGFTAHPADTTARWQMMNLLPPTTLTYRMQNGQPILLYADPIACGCVYMGDSRAYDAYRKSHPISLAEEQRMTAEINQHPGWDWSVWDSSADVNVVNGLRPGPSHVFY
ncbi:hypothetical protein GMO_13350 [Gluconobacter morbifer G707]|uniref:Uncharacterized protein n=1 Tax=Gluconobacter morbifer G707 TaxID=1088869 RepID=G6XIC5_9PROT|nr:hypothetical protein GMO_13350 [Gluconobacter morbifer G707]